MKWNNKSQIITSSNEEERANQFYQLHYPLNQNGLTPKKRNMAVRAKSFNTVLPYGETEKLIKERQSRGKMIVVDHVLTKDPFSEEQRRGVSQQAEFSFQKWLSKKVGHAEMKEYFYKNCKGRGFDLQEQSRRSMAVRVGLQRDRQQKAKMQKVLRSRRQPEEVKLNYLQLKRKETQQEIRNEIRMMYQQYFKKEYEEYSGGVGFYEFEKKVRTAMEIVHQQMFCK